MTQKITICAPSHNFVRLNLCNKGIYRQSEKKLKQQYLFHMTLQCGELWPTSGWDRFVSLGHPSKFQRVRILAAFLHGTLLMGVCQTLRRWTEGATYIRQGGHHVGHWPTSLLFRFLVPCGRLSWIICVSFWAHKYSLSYCIISVCRSCIKMWVCVFFCWTCFVKAVVVRYFS